MSTVRSASVSTAAEPAAISADVRRLALFCVCVMGFAYSANYTNHAPLVAVLRAQFGFTQALAGLLTTGIFTTHAAMQIPGGHLVDRFGARLALMFALVWVAFGNFGIAFSNAYWHLLAWKIFTGVGTGVCFVAGARYVHEVWAGPRLQVAQGMYGASVLLGSGFVIFAVPRISAGLGWRGAFVVSAAMAAGAWILWTAAAPNVVSRPHTGGRFSGMVLAPQLWLLGLMQMASFGLSIVVGSWITILLGRTLNVPVTQAGLIGSLVLVVGIVGRPLGGVLNRQVGIRSLLIGSFLSTAVGCFGLAWGGNSLALAIAAVVLVGIGCGLPYAALFTRAGVLFPGRAGAAMGLVNMLGIVMILVGAPLVGRLADWSGNFRSSFVALGAFSLIACAAVQFVGRED